MKSAKEDILQHIEENKNFVFKFVNAYIYYSEEQEDLTQEIFIDLLKSYEKFDHTVKITPRMYKIAFNVVISFNRKIKTRKKYFVPLKEKLNHIQEEKNRGR